MNDYICTTYVSPSSELYHHGIKGQKWGIRRYQNEDGSLTAAGKKRYGIGDRIRQRAQKVDAAFKEDARIEADTIRQYGIDRAQARLNKRQSIRNAKASGAADRKTLIADAKNQYKNDLRAAAQKYGEGVDKAYASYKDISGKDLAAHALATIAKAAIPALAGTVLYAKGSSVASAYAGTALMGLSAGLLAKGNMRTATAAFGKTGYNMLHPIK